MEVKQKFSANSMHFEFSYDGSDVRKEFMKNEKISKYFRQVILNPNFDESIKKLWKITDADCSLNEYKEKVIDAIAMRIFNAAIVICREHTKVAIEDVVCNCIINNLSSDSDIGIEIKTEAARALLNSDKINNAFKSIIQDDDIEQCLNDIEQISKKPNMGYNLLDGILYYCYYNACGAIVTNMSLSIEKAICNSMEKESVLNWLRQIKEYFFN